MNGAGRVPGGRQDAPLAPEPDRLLPSSASSRRHRKERGPAPEHEVTRRHHVRIGASLDEHALPCGRQLVRDDCGRLPHGVARAQREDHSASVREELRAVRGLILGISTATSSFGVPPLAGTSTMPRGSV